MGRIWAAAILFMLACTPAVVAQSRTTDEQRMTATVREIVAGASSPESIDEAERRLRALTTEPSFATLPSATQNIAYRGLATVLLAQRPYACEDVLSIADRLVRTDDGDERSELADTRIAFWSASACRSEERQRDALTRMVQRYPVALSGFNDDAVFQAALKLTDPETLEYFVDGRWRPHDHVADYFTPLRLRLTRLYLRHGELDSARRVAGILTAGIRGDINAAIILLVEKEFAPLLEANPAAFDFNLILGRQLSNVRAVSATQPNLLGPQNDLAEAFLVRDRKEEALAIVDAAIARMADPSTLPFEDRERYENWTHDLRAQILEAMNRQDDALDAFQHGADTSERGSDNVSQLLNRSATLVEFERPREALDALAHFSPGAASPYGEMVALRVRVCAHAQLGDNAAMQAALTEMRNRSADSLIQLRGAALCANDMNLAAETFIRLLAIDADRDWIVVGLLQDYIDDEDDTDFSRLMEERSDRLREHPGVRDAIDRVAIIRYFPIRQP